MSIKYVFFDLDDTLLTSDKRVTEETIRCLQYLKDRGLVLGTCTGRSWDSEKNVLEGFDYLKYFDVHVNDGGINVYDTARHEHYTQGALSHQQIRQIIRYFYPHDIVRIIMQIGDQVYASGYNAAVGFILKRNRQTGYHQIRLDTDYDAVRIVLGYDLENEDRVRELVAGMNVADVNPTISEPMVCNISHSSVSKALGVQVYLDRVGGKMEEVMFFGDSEIDVSILKQAGISVAMKNGFQVACEAAQYTTDKTCDEDGIADFIYSHEYLFEHGGKPMGKIVITPRGFANYGQDEIRYLESRGYEIHYNNTGKAYTRQQFLDYCRDAEGLIVGVEEVDREFIDNCPALRAVVKFGVGMDNFDLPYMAEKGIFAGRCVGSNSRSVAETAVSYMLAASKNLYDCIHETRQGGWNKYTGFEVLGKTVGIIGLGAIGKNVAVMCNGLGMKVLAYDTFDISPETEKEYNVRKTDLETLLKESDFITVHIPLTPETRDFISNAELTKMKKTAVLINTARGGVVNEGDLYKALNNRSIRAAYFDVFTSEPPLEGEKLLTLDNFYLTPHIASRSAEAEKNTVRIATEVILEGLER